LQHPHIVQIHEIGEMAGAPFFALEYVDGGSLAERLAGTPLAAPEAARLLEILARAIHYAHERGIIHRDLKPANIMIDAAGEPALAQRPNRLGHPVVKCVHGAIVPATRLAQSSASGESQSWHADQGIENHRIANTYSRLRARHLCAPRNARRRDSNRLPSAHSPYAMG
jgi:serine/threonine protein kinase